ncbi:MAG: carboxypeptidase regulatory-like domain-containing protein, partial [Pyrinomonadaceae bacterium]
MKKRLISCFVLLLLWCSQAIAQGTTSRVTGVVTDTAGAVVPGATVTLTNEGTGTSVSIETNNNGVYVFDLVQPGNYTVTVEKQGFKKFVSKNNAVFVNQPATVNVVLEPGDIGVTVTVEATAELVQTSTSGNVGGTVEQRVVESLPIVGLRGRNPLDILIYQPGFVIGANTGGGVHVHGSRDRAFNFTLDGIDINESSAGGSNFTPLRINPDSIQEFQFVSSNFTAELGRSSGAQVTFITRSGTNKLRGNLLEYYQTPDLNANEYQNNLNNQPKGQFVQHIFGGSLGGPIIKNRMFYFFNLQLLRAYETRLVTRTVYTQTVRNG